MQFPPNSADSKKMEKNVRECCNNCDINFAFRPRRVKFVPPCYIIKLLLPGKNPITFCATEGHLGETPTLPTYSGWVNLIELHFS